MIKKSILIFAFVLCLLPQVFSWNARGHMLIASIAYSQLSQADRDSAVSLLKFHPYYKDIWTQSYNGHEKEVEFGVYLFMKASLWADEIKGKESINHKLNNSPSHYITYKVQFPNNHDTIMPSTAKESNVVFGIDEAKKNLNNKELSKKERAIALAWAIHLIGDVHQPMHCGSLFNEFVPKGDKGGNLSYIFFGNSGTGIHKIWDDAFGKTRQYNLVVDTANALNSKYSNLNINSTYNPQVWSLESFNFAVKYGYLNGDLKIAYKKEEAVLPPKDYLSNMRELSDKQAVIAGHRLAQFITDLGISKDFYKTEIKN
jgi:hypothetical protein